MKILVIQGPNLNTLGQRQPDIYGTMTLEQIHQAMKKRGQELGVTLAFFQSNSEGAIIDYLQGHVSEAQGIIINPGALTHYGLSLHDALAALSIPIIEVHLSNIYAREPWRRRSVIAPVARGHISGLGWHGYLSALETLVAWHREGEKR